MLGSFFRGLKQRGNLPSGVGIIVEHIWMKILLDSHGVHVLTSKRKDQHLSHYNRTTMFLGLLCEH